MLITVKQNKVILQGWQFLLLVLFLAGCYSLLCSGNPKLPNGQKNGFIFFHKEGYDAKTGKWINKKPSTYAFSISPQVYEQVKNWYATDSGTNNPNNLPVLAPKEGYTYIFTPYKDKAHPNIHGMSIQGENGYKGYWYADDLTKVTDSSDPLGQAVALPPRKMENPALEYGGYDARTGNWVKTQPSYDAFPVSQGTYTRVKNWYATNFNTNNPLGLSVEVPKEDYTYLYVPFKDPKHPGIIGMSFQGDAACRGYWYADKIGETQDTVMTGNTNNSNVPPVQSTQPQQNQPVTSPTQSVPPPTQNQQQSVPPPQNQPSSKDEGNNPK